MKDLRKITATSRDYRDSQYQCALEFTDEITTLLGEASWKLKASRSKY
jgi:hypothetical protein